LDAKFIGAVTTVFTVETDVLATFFVVLVTEWVALLMGVKIDFAWHAAGRTSARSINVAKTAAKTRPNLKIMIVTFIDVLPNKNECALRQQRPGTRTGRECRKRTGNCPGQFLRPRSTY
jgi:hypothetical protein